MWDEFDTREHFVEFPTWDWGNGISKTISFSEMIRETNQFGRRFGIACQQVMRVGRIMSAFGYDPGDFWRIPDLVFPNLRLARMRSVLYWIDDFHFPHLRDLYDLLHVCRDHFYYYVSPGINWYYDSNRDDAINADFKKLSFLLDPMPPTSKQASRLLKLHKRSKRAPSSLDLDLDDEKRVPLSGEIQEAIADMLTSSRFAIPRPLELGNRSLDFGMYLMVLSNWVSDIRAKMPLDQTILFDPQFEEEESEILRFESRAYLRGSARNEQLPATAALLSDGGGPLMTATDLARAAGWPSGAKDVSTWLSRFRRQPKNAGCAVEVEAGEGVRRSRFLYHRSMVWDALLDFVSNSGKASATCGRVAEAEKDPAQKLSNS
ncbi:hypothetical protein J8F10_15645 [Gemmata sp. G18]|uniref:MarR family transcriptional regulator n=1 Tax=Gemmata palustris TaxID=2822762 RepID=A0ABS5BSN5_9BACT|nr:hypothetical protein [Gemmata palustris]MBP3956708.1 hypothetical protein [Gemmata palustris]